MKLAELISKKEQLERRLSVLQIKKDSFLVDKEKVESNLRTKFGIEFEDIEDPLVFVEEKLIEAESEVVELEDRAQFIVDALERIE